MNELALFAGAGGGILGSVLLGHRVVCAVEWDTYCQEVLLRRQEEGHLPAFPIWDDVRTFDGQPWRGAVDLVSGGFPCQPFSVAGQRAAEDDPRNMWPDTIRIIREVGPRFAFLENVPGLLSTPYWGTILGDLAEAGFDAEWCVVGTKQLGGPSAKERVWCLAAQRDVPGGPVLPERQAATRPRRATHPDAGYRWKAEPEIRRVDDGTARWVVQRNRAIGNIQVPIVAARAFQMLMERIC